MLKLFIIGFISSGFGFKGRNLTGLGGFLPILFLGCLKFPKFAEIYTVYL
jgi:hypothetical protein